MFQMHAPRPCLRMLVLELVLLCLFPCQVFSQETPAPSDSLSPAPEGTVAPSAEVVNRLRERLQSEIAEVDNRLQMAKDAGDASVIESIEQERSLLLRADFFYIQHLATEKRLRELGAELLQLQQQGLGAGADNSITKGNPVGSVGFVAFDSYQDARNLEDEHITAAQAGIQNAIRLVALARKDFEDKEKARRRAKEELDLSKEVEKRPLLERAQRIAELDSRGAEELVKLREAELSTQQKSLEVATLKKQLLVEKISLVKAVISFSEEELKQIISTVEGFEKLAKRELESAKDLLEASEVSEEEKDSKQTSANPISDEAIARRMSIEAANIDVALLGERLHLYGVLKELWSRRFKIFHQQATPEELSTWRKELQELSQFSQTQTSSMNARLAELRRDLASVESRLKVVDTTNPEPQKSLKEQRRQIQREIRAYGRHLDEFDAVQKLAAKTLAEIGSEVGPPRFGDIMRYGLDAVASVWNFEIATVDDRPITVHKIIVSLILVIVGIFLSRFASRQLQVRLLTPIGVAAGASAALESLVFYFLILFFTFFALHLVHVPLTVFTLLGGAVAIGVGFGSQNIMNNFISGLILLIERPIRVGDLIEVESFQGRVQHIGARSTRILTGNNVDLVVPNSVFLEKHVVNWTLTDQKARNKIEIGVAYGSPVEKVKELMLKVAMQSNHVLNDPPPFVVLAGFGDNALQFRLYFWTRLSLFTSQLQIESELREALLKELNEAEVVLPFPQRTVWLGADSAIRVKVENG